MTPLFNRFGKVIAVALVLSASAFATSAYATHSWGSYHWARTANPFNLKLGDNVSAAWDGYLRTTSSDWSTSSVLKTAITSGAGLRKCGAVLGRVEVCNDTYGNNGWLGLASTWSSGSHITKATVKLNDTYFNKATYNTTAWKNMVMCQEVGHTFGLDHQDENQSNANLNTCMDYTNRPDSNQHPNAHDYEQLELIYAHLDGSTTVSQITSSSPANANATNEDDLGKVVRKDSKGRPTHYERDLGKGEKIFTFIIWADSQG